MTAVSRRKSIYQNNIVLLFTVSSLFFISQALAVFKTRCQRAPFFFFVIIAHLLANFVTTEKRKYETCFFSTLLIELRQWIQCDTEW